MKELIGKIIKKVYLEKDKSSIIFETDQGLFKFAAEGDCCSSSWFDDCLGIDDIIDKRVYEVKELEGYFEYCSDYETIKMYGVKILTENPISGEYPSCGFCELVYRNSSNGYYGGNISEAIEIKEFNIDNYKDVSNTSDWRG